MAILMPRKLFTVDEYYRMAKAGILAEDDRVELIEGEIIEIAPIGPRHASVVDKLAGLLMRAISPTQAVVRVQGPVRLNDRSEPVPDLAVLQPKSYAEHHPLPPDVMLLVEVADSSLLSDQRVKVPLYAENSIAEVWIVNLVNQTVEVHSQLSEDGEYASQTIASRGERVSPSTFPSLFLAVDDILS
jgi:Uma2 family endonuclease